MFLIINHLTIKHIMHQFILFKVLLSPILIVSECNDEIKKVIQNRGLNDASTNVLMRHLKRRYKFLLIDSKCYLEKENPFSTELIDFVDFDPYATGKYFDADINPYWSSGTKPIAYINRLARKLLCIQNNNIEELNELRFISDMNDRGLHRDNSKTLAIAYLLEKSNLYEDIESKMF